MTERLPYAAQYLAEARSILDAVPCDAIEVLAVALARLRDRGGRLFVLGLGGSAALAGHAVNDFRKLCNVQAYAPTDNIPELTARANDDGFATCLSAWLRTSCLRGHDAVLTLSVSGESPALLAAVRFAQAMDAKRYALCGRLSTLVTLCNESILVPRPPVARTTPHVEGTIAVLLHCLVSHPELQESPAAWERTQ